MDIKTSTTSSSLPLDLKQELLARKRGIEGANPLTDSFNLLVMRTVVDCCATATAEYKSELADFERIKAQTVPLPRRNKVLRFLALMGRELTVQTPSDPQGYCKADNIVPFFAQGEGGAVFAALDLLSEKGLVEKNNALILLRVRPTELGAQLASMEEQPALLPPSKVMPNPTARPFVDLSHIQVGETYSIYNSISLHNLIMLRDGCAFTYRVSHGETALGANATLTVKERRDEGLVVTFSKVSEIGDVLIPWDEAQFLMLMSPTRRSGW